MEIESVYCEGYPIFQTTNSHTGWVLYEDFEFLVNGKVYTIPRGFVTDLTSIPLLATLIFPRWGPYGPASLIHDYCYYNVVFSQKECDYIFKQIMLLYKTAGWKVFYIYWAVRLFGGFPYRRYRKNTCNE